MKKIILSIFMILTLSIRVIDSTGILSSKKIYNIGSMALGVFGAFYYKEVILHKLWPYYSASDNRQNLEAAIFGAFIGLGFKAFSEKCLRFKNTHERLIDINKELNNIDKNLLKLILSKDIVKALNLYESEILDKYPLIVILYRLENLNNKLKALELYLNSIDSNISLSEKLKSKICHIKNKILNVLFYLKSLSEFKLQFDIYNQESSLINRINYLKRKKMNLLSLKRQASRPPVIIYHYCR